MTPRTLLTAALGCAALSLGCTGPDDAARTASTATDTPAGPPLETYSADFKPDSAGRLFHYSTGFFDTGVVNARGVHGRYVEDFLRHPGAGFGRLGPPPSPWSDWTELVAVSSDGNHAGSGAVLYNPKSETLTLEDGTPVERRERVWLLQDRHLVGLVVAPEPAVYLNTPKNQHELMKTKTDGASAPKRALDAFETEALEKLRAGDEVALRADDKDMRMLGAIRARKDCLSCHKVEVGTLLGAFSYTLKAQSEETPAEHKLTDLAGLTDKQIAAVRGIESSGGKVIRTPGGPVTEVKMTFARNAEMAIPRNGSHSTRLMLRDSALAHLLAFPELTAVDVSKSLVSDAGLKTLAELKNLKKLDVQHTSTTAAGVTELKKALPGCEVAASPPPPVPPTLRPR